MRHVLLLFLIASPSSRSGQEDRLSSAERRCAAAEMAADEVSRKLRSLESDVELQRIGSSALDERVKALEKIQNQLEMDELVSSRKKRMEELESTVGHMAIDVRWLRTEMDGLGGRVTMLEVAQTTKRR